MPDMTTPTIIAVHPKFNRCLEVRLSDGTIIPIKVQGDKVESAKLAKALLGVLVVNLPVADMSDPRQVSR